MAFMSQGAFGSDSDDKVDLDACFDELMEEETRAGAGGGAEGGGAVAVEEINIRIACMDGTTFSVSVAKTATVEELKKQIADSRDIIAVTIGLFVAGNEDALPNSSLISSLEFKGDAVVFMLRRDIHEVERLALVALYESTDGADWHNNTNWNTDAPIGKWHGLAVTDGKVIGLDLSSNQLSGSIPAALGQLRALEWLYLQNNQLEGSMPTELGQLGALEDLDLSSNQLSGPIPPELGSLTSLEVLRLYGNQLSDTIPAELGQLTALIYLGLSNNQHLTISDELKAQLRGNGCRVSE